MDKSMWRLLLDTMMFQDVRARIYEEFDKSKADRVYQDARTNFLYLHDKMAHIKKLVHDYDIGQRRLAAR